MTRSSPFIVTALALVAAASAARAQAAPSPAVATKRIIGVYDAATGDPLPGVQVVDAFTSTYATTTATGTASLSFLTFRGKAGMLELRKIGYKVVSLIVDPADTNPITTVMEHVAELPAVVTTEKFRIDLDGGKWEGFERRCAVAHVSCFRESDIAKRGAGSIGDVVARAEGVKVTSCGKSASSRRMGCLVGMTSTTGGTCMPTYYVDGFRWDTKAMGMPPIDGPNSPPVLAPFTPANVKAVEVYTSEKTRPMRFSGDVGCGVIAIWTK